MSKLTELKDQIVKSREDLKVAFEDVNEDGKYSAEGKEKIKGLNTELAGLVEDIKIEEAKVQNEKAMEVDETPVNAIPNAEQAEAQGIALAPQQGLGFFGQMLGAAYGAPGGTTFQTTPDPSTLQTLLGAGTGILGILGASGAFK